MPAEKQTIEDVLWKTKRTSEDDESIRPGDYRDPDLYLVLDGAQVVPNDAAWRGHEKGTAVEPDWGQGWQIMGPGPNQPMLATGQGVPPSPLKECCLQGRVLFGCIIARDLQRHNA